MPVEQTVTTAGSGCAPGARRSRGLADIAPQYVAKSGLCAATEMESSRGGSIRIQHLTASTGSPSDGRSRFPKLDECAHFHYEQVELGPFQVGLYDEELKSLACEDSENKWWHVSVTSQGKTWVLRRSYDNFRMLDQQLHRCIYDRKFSGLAELPPEENVPGTNQEESIRRLLTDYLSRFSQIAGNLINCGPVLNWLELDNRGRRLLVPDGDNCPINTPAVAAAYSVKRYTAQAGDEISFEVGDMISVIDMPPPEESVWWRGKRGFQVGFFPCECVAVIGDKVPRNLQLPAAPSEDQPSKPVLRKHGKLIAFFRSFILSRPSRRRLKQSGILKERVFGCDLGEHLLNSGHEIPMVLKCCAEFIESNGIVDGIYRLSGVTSNIQKLRNAFDEDRVPALYEDEAILQDIHSVASLLKMYFRELPNPLCTYQLYHTFVSAVQSSQEEGFRLLRMRDAVQKLPPPHYRTLEYLMRHLARVAERGHMTGMTPRNVAIVWAPNLLRCKELEVGGVAALQGVGVQAVVTEFLVCYTDLIFCDGLPPISLPPQEVTPKRSRPKSLAISTPTKLLSLEEARSRALLSAGKADQEYIEVGGGPSNLPAKYHTVIELPGSARKRAGSKRSPLGWKSFFSKSGRKSSGAVPPRKASTPSDLGLHQEKAVTESDLAQGRRRLRPVKSAESLASGANSSRNSAALEPAELGTPEDPSGSKASGHNRSVSHDSYFDHLAETPVHSRPTMRPSRLQEEDNEDNFSSSLDLSEIQLNFDLEESEMRIFSEDETLVSTSVGSGSFMSQGSPRVGGFRSRQQGVGGKRVPMREIPPPCARPEDPLSCCPSTDPSPKKQKTCGSTSPGSSRSKRSRLEEQLACSSAELRYIDSQSPENQVLVHAEIHANHQHHPYSNLPDINISPNNHTNNTSPSLADATVSDNESFTLHSSGLTTPDTPLLLYAPLMDDSNDSSNTTPDYENLTAKLTPSSGNKYERLSTASLTPSPTNILGPRIDGDTKFDRFLSQMQASSIGQGICDTLGRPRYENVPVSNQGMVNVNSDASQQYNNVSNEISTNDSELTTQVVSNYTDISADLQGGNSSPVRSPVKKEAQIIIKYGNILSESPTKKSPIIKQPDLTAYETLSSLSKEQETHIDTGAYEVMADVHATDESPTSVNIVYQNIPSAFKMGNEEEHLYEDIQVALAASPDRDRSPSLSPKRLSGMSDHPNPDVEVYQQVKYLRRSIHEVNQLLDDCAGSDQGSAGMESSVPRATTDVAPSESESGNTTPVDSEVPIECENDTPAEVYSLEQSKCDVDESKCGVDESNCGEVVDKFEDDSSDVILVESVECDELKHSTITNETFALEEPNKNCDSLKGVEVAEVQIMETDEGSPRIESPTKTIKDFEVNMEEQSHPSGIEQDKQELRMDNYEIVGSSMETSLPSTLADFETDRDDSYIQVSVPINAERGSFQFQSEGIVASRLLAKEHHSSSGSGLEGKDVAVESPTSSPERRSSSAVGSPLDSSRRKFESEIGRDIVRERKMRQELEEMRTATQGSGATSPQQHPKSTCKQNVKCHIRELLSKFEISPTQPEAEAISTDDACTSLQGTDQKQDENSNADMNYHSVTPVLTRRSEPNSTKGPTSLVISASANTCDSSFSSLTPKLVRRSDPIPKSNTGSLPPCMRARAAKAARSKLANSTSLSVSLDGEQFFASNSSPQALLRVQTSPDINMAEHGDPSLTENRAETEDGAGRVENTVYRNTQNIIDMDDPQRRERIERYKEERRNFLREKYRSESFRGERDEILQRLKQKAGKSLSSPTDEAMDMSKSLSSGERVRTSSFRSTGDKSDTSDAEPIEQCSSTNDRLSDTGNVKGRERRYGRHISPKKFEMDSLSGDENSRRSRVQSLGEDSLHKSSRKSKFEDDENYRRQHTSFSEKERINSSSSEKSPITCVTVRQRLSSDRMTVGSGLSSSPKSPREGWAPVGDKQVVVDESRTVKHMSPTVERRIPTRHLVDSAADKSQNNPENASNKHAAFVMDKPSDRRATSTVKSPSKTRQSSTPDTFTERRLTSKVGSVEKRPSSTDYAAEIRLTSKGYSFEKRPSPIENRSVELRLSPKGACSTGSNLETRQSFKRSSYDSPGVEVRSKDGSSDVQRRPVSSPGDSPRRRASADCGSRPPLQTSPSYCIRDMAALFENREAASAPPNRPNTGKQYLSSV